ncbi:site-specific integrase [Pedobacter sp. ISL-68]|uniref:phage integrase SAM-like domain-containing protein n=1 Tax=unclassified Pedobacter TaxID=2628915 RepID=UPI001BE55342|nr:MULTISPECIES: phage integrase SAM-like domain-containing protein [unclassified Pedobacter]MBT2560069.1 site-specific integrase [Pedobacter sp. ISL-64]MBT2589048.1 site-specific integrase [Pedobacter sp. ISL-68]
MATISAKIYKHHKKADGTYNVKVCIFHKGQRRYIHTNHYLVRKQLSSKFKIKDKFIADLVERQLIDYRKTVSELGNKLSSFSAEALRDYIRDKDADIDFIVFCDEHIQKTKLEGREGTAYNHRKIKNSLTDYFRRQVVSVTEITSAMLISYECYLKSERKMSRINQLGKMVVTIKPAMSERGVHNQMKDLRTLFNAARDFYNNEDLEFCRIKHYPFKKYKLGPVPLAKKRNNSIEEVLLIRDCVTEPGSRAELAKELYILSFLTCGMNAVDLYSCTKDNIRDGRINYNRSKTKRKRRDDAFISIKIVEEAKPLLMKYIDKLRKRYATYGTLDSALSKGMKEICKKTGLDGVTFYWARYTFANLARNSCRMSKDDVLLAMNHVDMASRMVDVYIERDWKIVDEVQLKVLQLYRAAGVQLVMNEEPQYEEYYY